MSDFDALGASDVPAQEEDPAADFFAREQDQLAELNDDNFTGAEFTEQSQVPASTGDDFMSAFGSETVAAAPAVAQVDDMFSPIEPAPTTDGETEQAQNEDDVMAQFSSEPVTDNTDVGGGIYSEPEQSVPASLDIFDAPGESNTDGDAFGFGGGEAIPGLDDLDQRLNEEDGQLGQADSSDPYSSVRSVDTQRNEPEKIRIWRENQITVLENKDAEEIKKKEEWRESARKELDDWYRHRDEQFQKAKALNREANAQILKELQKESENEFIKERDESLPGHEWERICRLCEFNPKNHRGQKDIARMRSILLQLKQNPSVQAKVM